MPDVTAVSKGKRILRCSKCGFTFDVTYGRTFACSGCPSLVHCEMAKCPKCGHEFPLESRPRHAYSGLYPQSLRA